MTPDREVTRVLRDTSHPLPTAADAAALQRRQRNQHLLAIYVSASDYARQLEEALTLGRSPTGYGSPLTPIDPEAAEAILAPVRAYLARMRELVACHAPDELAAHETVQPVENTMVWASNLLERLRQLADDFSPRRMRKYGGPPGDPADMAALQEELVALIASAREQCQD